MEHSYPIDFSDPTAVGRTVGTISASPTKPAVVDAFIIIQTASNGTTHSAVVALGGLSLVGATDLKAVMHTVVAGTKRIITANSAITITPTITGVPTTGRAWLCVQARELNVDRTAK